MLNNDYRHIAEENRKTKATQHNGNDKAALTEEDKAFYRNWMLTS